MHNTDNNKKNSKPPVEYAGGFGFAMKMHLEKAII